MSCPLVDFLLAANRTLPYISPFLSVSEPASQRARARGGSDARAGDGESGRLAPTADEGLLHTAAGVWLRGHRICREILGTEVTAGRLGSRARGSQFHHQFPIINNNTQIFIFYLFS
jgi:hypothetical protein